MTNYNEENQQAKKLLAQLKREQIELPLHLSEAIQDSNAADILRLHRRKIDLPSEIYTAEIMVLRTEVSRLKGELAAAHNRVDEAKARSKATDGRTLVALKLLDEERQRINQEAFADFIEIQEAQNHLSKVLAKLREAEMALTNLISEAA